MGQETFNDSGHLHLVLVTDLLLHVYELTTLKHLVLGGASFFRDWTFI